MNEIINSTKNFRKLPENAVYPVYSNDLVEMWDVNFIPGQLERFDGENKEIPSKFYAVEATEDMIIELYPARKHIYYHKNSNKLIIPLYTRIINSVAKLLKNRAV